MQRTSSALCLGLLLLAGDLSLQPAVAATARPDYAVVVSTTTAQDSAWAKVVEALKRKHNAAVIACAHPTTDSKAALLKLQPRYVCFVAAPDEIDVGFVRRIHLLSRAMDADPYADFLWGIITGYRAEDALRIATTEQPLTVKRAMTTTGVNPELFDTCLTLSDANPPGNWMIKTNGVTERGHADPKGPGTAGLFRSFYDANDVDLFVTSGHATQVNLEMPFSMGSLMCWSNQFYALDRTNFISYVRAMSRGRAEGGLWFCSPDYPGLCGEWVARTTAPTLRKVTNPRVFLAAGNCLIGDAMKSRNSMVITWLSAGGVDQFVGYTVPTWYGKGGWGTLSMWESSRGQLTLSEAFFLNNQRVVRRLLELDPALDALVLDEDSVMLMSGEKRGPPTPVLEKLSEVLKSVDRNQRRDTIGLLYDRDTLALYGDPKWEARLDSAKGNGPLSWKWKDEPKGGLRLEVTANSDYSSSEALLLLLPRRVNRGQVQPGSGLEIELNDEFLLIPKPAFERGKTYGILISGIRA